MTQEHRERRQETARAQGFAAFRVVNRARLSGWYRNRSARRRLFRLPRRAGILRCSQDDTKKVLTGRSPHPFLSLGAGVTPAHLPARARAGTL
jgi:hypothetical protein